MKIDPTTIAEVLDREHFRRIVSVAPLTRREYFAAAALSGYLAWPGGNDMTPEEIAGMSVYIADRLITFLAVPPLKTEDPKS